MLELNPVRALLDDGHLALGRAFDEFAKKELLPLPHAEDDGAARTQAREIMHTMGAAHFLDPILGHDLRACCVMREMLGYAAPLADAVFALQALGSVPIALAGSDALKERWLAPAMKGELMAAFAMTERGAGSDVGAMTTTARRDGDEYVLDGGKTLISNAGIADFYTVFASTDRSRKTKGISCFVVGAETPGLEFAKPQIMSAPHPIGEITFTECRVPTSALLGAEGEGFKLGMTTLDRLRPTVGAAACGLAARALHEALDHATQREQFGTRLADFQLIQHKLARMATDLTAARLLVYRAAWQKDQGAERITMEAAMAKAFATEAAQRIVDDAVQILGGRGVLADSTVDRLYRSVRALRIYEGTTEIQHLIIAGQLIKQHRSGASAG
ncbi:MAG: acyl-CoA dehydrogenase family protein [Gemmatimonadetes bacterium]|nr:acyl-CoA dehydrogenase family protein [Gemmatimonadota bacterium]